MSSVLFVRNFVHRLVGLVVVAGFMGAALTAVPAIADPDDVESLTRDEGSGSSILRLAAPDMAAIHRRDDVRARIGSALHFAAPRSLDVDVWSHGAWHADRSERPPRDLVWRLSLVSEGATSISLVFDRFQLPPGTTLSLGAGGETLRALTAADAVDGPLYTPPVLGSRIDLELRLGSVRSDDLESLDLHISRLHHGYAGFGSSLSPCRISVACAEDADDPRTGVLARSVGLLVVDGVRYCTGFLVNNSAEDGRPLVITAAHCGLDRRNAASVVMLWNYRHDACGPHGGASRLPAEQFQIGAELLAAQRETDLALLELRSAPDRRWNLTWAGWDRSDDAPRSGFVIHHPDASAQSVARTGRSIEPSAHLGMEADATGDHLRVPSWDVGTTEGGSSGSPLFDESGRMVGWLRGGHAACGNRLPDWFGRLAAAWDDGRGPEHRLRDWLDPLDTQAVVLDAYAP